MIKEVFMGQIWQLQEAKNKFSKLVEKAQSEGPQFVTKHGKESVVVLSVEDYQRIIKPKSNLFQFIQSSPLSKISVDIERDKSVSRDIEL
jgi:antitoxin Phd